jgi:AAA+ superfamily predicted ATPase
MDVMTHTSKAIEQEIRWFEQVLEAGMSAYFQQGDDLPEVTIPEIDPQDETPYALLVRENGFNTSERLLLILAAMPFLKPQALDLLLIKNTIFNIRYTEFGGINDSARNGFIPTLETACFILAGDRFEDRLQFIHDFTENHPLYTLGILEQHPESEFGLSLELRISRNYLHFLVTGKKPLPQYNSKFPAKEITSQLDWEDLIVEESVKHDLREIQEWLTYSELIMKDWNLGKNLKSGYRALFYGPPGTGKTLAATLLGKATSRPVFRVDLSLVVSKYIGETEKNLGRLFDEAAFRDWILFFDEADALFGKRTQTKGSNDRYANQEVAYLLQRIEDFPGLVVLATNLQANMDEAFARRFQSTILFPKPAGNERKQLWNKLLFENFEVDDRERVEEEISKYDLSGGQMLNVLRYCAIQAARRNSKKVSLTDIVTGIKREYSKDHKTI